MKQTAYRIFLILISVFLSFSLIGCSKNKLSNREEKDAMNYLENKYNKSFQILDSYYIYPNNFITPWFLSSPTDNFTIQFKDSFLNDHDLDDRKLILKYNSENDTYTDNFQYDNIAVDFYEQFLKPALMKLSVPCLVSYDKESIAYVSVENSLNRDSFTIYPHYFHHFYKDDIKSFLQKETVTLRQNASYRSSILCIADSQIEADDVLNQLDDIFLPLGKDTLIEISILSLEDYNKYLSQAEKWSFPDPEPQPVSTYMQIRYSNGKRIIE